MCFAQHVLCTSPGYVDAPYPGGDRADGFWHREHHVTYLAAVPRAHTLMLVKLGSVIWNGLVTKEL